MDVASHAQTSADPFDSLGFCKQDTLAKLREPSRLYEETLAKPRKGPRLRKLETLAEAS